ncbi:hypothetical protein 2 [Beihai picorna-like virus 43]|uniref:hypothetical protein 2 n=1 Tax=Beihai picorna-like virus 43 TaxID=1922587 RepID=UPI000909DCCF|nr:hypothetical protein 2 [Beihai picorna-like virus 43]APG76735.1 hypothetical protein 2 [Beihai picorna-like virus 43]APG76792.1 hypothetical protein 2 [Beihai picorna-like virus 43]APG76832.1 hypothetical protein 2 [Beihai picorna-like virus 43]APG76909.1 hypothetical protein 2 [Beihai picorna-like virus 43]APG78019.1 hypothetical protein 2 [Beihai picorna-like virus 43]
MPAQVAVTGGVEVPAPTDFKQVTTSMNDARGGIVRKMNTDNDPTFTNTYDPGMDINTFLSRPVKIQSIDWTIGGTIRTSFSPWYDFFNHSSIKNKIQNYNYINCKLKVKFMINASPFYYGAALASYGVLEAFAPNPIANVIDYPFQCVLYSQRPHIWIYPSNSEGGTLELPFVYFKEWLDLTSSNDITNMGSIMLITPTTLGNANGITGKNITISIYAWAEDVKLCGPTISAAMQADEDEYDGPISLPASAIANAAGALSRIPIIKPFATATTMIASNVARFASLFGFTNAPVIESVKPYKSMNFHSFASSEISQPIEKLTLDPKNELSIDNRIIGLDGEDELIITSLAQRENFLCSCAWSESDAVDHLLFAANVSPGLAVSDVVSGVDHIHFPILSWIAQNFVYWRGDIIFTFKFICTQYHRGRVLICWDPSANLSTTVGGTSTNLSRIVDINEETEVEVRVNYNQLLGYRRCAHDTSVLQWTNSGGALTSPSVYDNGCLSVRVLTEQTSPVASASIHMLVSIRGAENIEFANPRLPYENYQVYIPQSEELEYDKVSAQSLSNTTDSAQEDYNLVYHGERVKSLRTLLRRTVLSRVDVFHTDSTKRCMILSKHNQRMPLYPGYDLNGVDLATGLISGVNEAYNWSCQTPLNWIRMAFLGSRGSVIWHYNWDSRTPLKNLVAYRKHLDTGSITTRSTTLSVANTLSTDNVRKLITGQFKLGSGASVMNQLTQTGMSILAPMYNNHRFVFNRASTATQGSSEDGSQSDVLYCDATTIDPSANVDVDLFQYVCAGTDYTPVYFNNVPTIYAISSIPNVPS